MVMEVFLAIKIIIETYVSLVQNLLLKKYQPILLVVAYFQTREKRILDITL